MYLKIAVLCFTACTFIQADKDDKKWVWGDNNRNGKSSLTNPISLDNKASARYEVFEDEYPYEPNFLQNNQRPLIGDRPPPYRPSPIKPNFPLNERPGGVYGPQPGVEGDLSSGILTGPVPSWVKERPYKEFDRCKCTEKFNCNGVSYGHCDIGKQYCCISTKNLASPEPSRPVYSAENGVLVGPGGPADRPVGTNGQRYPRPGAFPGPGGNYPRPGGAGFGLGGNSQNSGPFPSNGVLVGPGGPYDRPYNRPGGSYDGGYGGGYGIGRSSKKE